MAKEKQVEAKEVQTVEEPVVVAPTPEELVDKISLEYGVNPVLMKAIIQCESEWRVEVKNPNSSATGLAQFITSTWRSTMLEMGLSADTPRTDVETHIKALAYRLSKPHGERHWNASRYCWSKLI